MNAFCIGCSFSSVPRPSSVVTGLPRAPATGVTHERIALPPRWTVQAPHCERPQPKRGPCRWNSLRSTYNNGVSGVAWTLRYLPFTWMTNLAMRPPYARVQGLRPVDYDWLRRRSNREVGNRGG